MTAKVSRVLRGRGMRVHKFCEALQDLADLSKNRFETFESDIRKRVPACAASGLRSFCLFECSRYPLLQGLS